MLITRFDKVIKEIAKSTALKLIESLFAIISMKLSGKAMKRLWE